MCSNSLPHPTKSSHLHPMKQTKIKRLLFFFPFEYNSCVLLSTFILFRLWRNDTLTYITITTDSFDSTDLNMNWVGAQRHTHHIHRYILTSLHTHDWVAKKCQHPLDACANMKINKRFWQMPSAHTVWKYTLNFILMDELELTFWDWFSSFVDFLLMYQQQSKGTILPQKVVWPCVDCHDLKTQFALCVLKNCCFGTNIGSYASSWWHIT